MLDYVAVLERAGGEFVDRVGASDLDRVVPSCPGWAIRDLAAHQGRVWEWARQCLETGSPAERAEVPVQDADLGPWLTESRDSLVASLRSTDPATPTWTFGPRPHTAGFWRRRQAHEVTVHLWDLQAAAGTPVDLPEDIAADGVDEVFSVFIPRQVRLERMSTPETGVRLHLPDGRSYDLGSPVTAHATGSAGDLLLALWGRVPLERLDITGDPDAARMAFQRALTP